MKKKPMTASELMTELQNDKSYQDKMQAKEKDRISFEELLRANEKNLVDSVNQKGYQISSVWDLVNAENKYSDVIPILIDHIKQNYHPRIKEGMARALAVPQASNTAWDTLLGEYLRTAADEDITEINRRGYKSGLAVALSCLINEKRIEVVLELIQNNKHKSSRIFLLDALRKYKKNQKVIEVVKKLKNDNDLKKLIKEKF